MSSKKLPSFSQWKQLFKILKGTERIFFLVLVVLVFSSAAYLAVDFYINNTKVAPGYGGTYTEGVVGQPRFINPIYGETDDIDRTLIDLVYSGLMTYDKDGKIVNDLVKSYQVSDDGKTYTFLLKDDLFWQDGMPLTADDVIYTIKTIQNSDYKSPQRANWLDVDVQKISDKSFAFSLNAPYNSFLENCTVKIIPSHIWKNVLPENAALSSYNLQPIGSGPYTILSVNQANTGFIKSLGLMANQKYYNKLPYISNIYFQFFSNKDDLIKAANQKTIDGFSVTDLDDNQASAEKEVRQGWNANEKFDVYSFSMPRYFAVFFNTDPSKILSDSNITQALNYAVNKPELVQKIEDSFKEKVSVVDSPILPDYFGYSAPTITYDFNTDAANKLLDKSGYKDSGNGQRAKPNNKKPAFQFKSYLSAGSKGNEVVELQGCLARLDPSFKTLLQGETSGKYGTGTGAAVTAFQKKYMPDISPTGEVGTSTRAKLNELCLTPQSNSFPLKFTLTTVDQPQMVQAANLLKNYWQKVGVTVDVSVIGLSDLKDVIKNRNYDALLYGQALGSEPDLYPFWHSTQINDPGLNLAEYQSKNADQLLKNARETLDAGTKAQDYEKLQNTILSDAPALFLYNPDYLYWVSEKVKGVGTTKIVDPAKRFANIQNWYINTRRIFK
ncbi:MAG: ABC transporter substrate-binding protein [Candidatus Staskawiczbacteria bacterium]|jgi:ABC-type transport system substrate-binding protein